LTESNADLPPERRIEFRIGIHQGDIVVEDGDIFGDGVNIAARLDLAFEDMGEQALKNIAARPRIPAESGKHVWAGREGLRKAGWREI
jgi:adenylate cyclase